MAAVFNSLNMIGDSSFTGKQIGLAQFGGVSTNIASSGTAYANLQCIVSPSNTNIVSAEVKTTDPATSDPGVFIRQIPPTNTTGNVLLMAGTNAIGSLAAGANTIGKVVGDFATRADTYTTTGNGVSVDLSAKPCNSFSIEVKGTGAVPSAWDVRLEVSLDNANWTQAVQHTNSDGDGTTKSTGSSFIPALYMRSRCAGLTLLTATNVVTTILGVP